MTEALLRLTCRRCAGTGTLHSRVANFWRERGVVTYVETHRPCDLCGGDGVNKGALP